jgi:hypothetical protein
MNDGLDERLVRDAFTQSTSFYAGWVILCDPNGNLLTWFIDRNARSLWIIFGDVSEDRS